MTLLYPNVKAGKVNGVKDGVKEIGYYVIVSEFDACWVPFTSELVPK